MLLLDGAAASARRAVAEHRVEQEQLQIFAAQPALLGEADASWEQWLPILKAARRTILLTGTPGTSPKELYRMLRIVRHKSVLVTARRGAELMLAVVHLCHERARNVLCVGELVGCL